MPFRLFAALLLSLFAGGPVAAMDGPARATRQMVAAAHPLAAQAGLDILRAGGSAADAAVAIQAMLSVVEPNASGLLGGSLLLHWSASSRRLDGYEGLASAPAAAPARLAEGTDLTRGTPVSITRSGRAIGVPGALRMLAMVHADHGRLPWRDLLAPAIRVAEEGFPLPPTLHRILETRPAQLARDPDIRALLFGADGSPLPVGALIRNPAQAAALRLLAEGGAEALYTGPLGRAVLNAVAREPLPGWMTAEDLAGYEARRRDPVCSPAFGRQVCSAAPPSAGVTVQQQLGLLERLGIARVAPDSPEAAHLILEASRLGTADRRRWLGDPDRAAVPAEALVSEGYLKRRAALVAPGQAMRDAPAGNPLERQGALPPPGDPLALWGTSQAVVVDAAGNALSLTMTNNLNFGAERLAAGIVLNNGLTNFAADPGPAGAPAFNRMEGGKRPATSMAPTIVLGADGAPELLVGSAGGLRIIDSIVLATVEVLAWGADARRATARPRIGAQMGREELEEDSQAADLAGPLRAMGHRPVLREMNTGLQLIRRVPGGWEGAADPRRDGVALGD
ncbi:gamma-glutamyltransferase [Roseomonas sp. SSH11]|uniref:Gamma-glutamyltransferase n=1 Tax=Pararoseomonas baculiformis TaxID=2820812 RepID=A0ABS4ABH2_9PROT|nr:gamma-glutamyltransferase [Pararoseomonas baculiformis]MBP0444357.1 gamma-glutamyltransferase [Pararoseomonas baculiformis]